MKANWICAVVLCAAGTAAAQDRTPNPHQMMGQTVTMSGCVTREDMSYASGRKAVDGRAVTSGGDADRFLLSDARPSMGGHAAATGASGSAAGHAETMEMGAKYLLVAKSADLRPHLGHQVEVTGHLGGMDAGAGTGPAAVKNRNEASSPQFTVDSIKMIASTCTGK